MYENWKPNFIFVKKRKIIAHTDPEGKNLYITKDKFPWDDIMYAMMYYMVYEDKIVCPYCGNIIKVSQLTVDHKFPKHFGGISLISNLVLCCKKCNSIKGDLNQEEFMRIMRITDEAKRKEAVKKILAEKEKDRRTKIFLPKEWVTTVKVEDVHVRKNYINSIYDFKENQNSYISNTGRVKRPIILDKNNVIIDGWEWFIAALKNGLTEIDAVSLENCIWK